MRTDGAQDTVTLVVEVPSLVDEVAAAGLKSDIADLWRRVREKFSFDETDIPDFVDCHLHREDVADRSRVIVAIENLSRDHR